MTAMERTEELVQNLLVAQNELILHLSILKRVPDLARVLFGSVEKNSTPEKNSAPEKNSSEMEKIRQTWMDDVVGLASEFYINEEAFNLENLSELLKATVGAIADILVLGPEENSVDRTEKKFTFLDKLKEDRPDLAKESDEYLMMRYCISEFGYGKDCPYENGPISVRCVECWNREYKYSDTDSVNQTKKAPETCRERLRREHPDDVRTMYVGGCKGCPTDFGYIPEEKIMCLGNHPHRVHGELRCVHCWDQPSNP